MKIIDKFIEHLQDETDGAMEYCEKYIENKAIGNTSRAAKYKEMASDELKHAEYIENFAHSDLADIERVYTVPEEDKEEWKHFVRKMNEKIAQIKIMLN